MLTRAVIATTALLSLGSLDARADTWGNVHCEQASCDLEVGTGHDNGWDSGRPGVGTSTGEGDDPYAGCRRVQVDGAPPPGADQAGRWFMVLCSPDGKDPLSHGPVWVEDEGPSMSPAEVAQMARERLRLPSPKIAVSPSVDQLVNLPTWMWLTGGWTSASATASVPGVSVTATATASSVVWSMGDGTTVTCIGAGTPYTPSVDPKAPSPDCGHVYRRSSAGRPAQAFPITVTVHWTVSWSGAGQNGAFPDMTTTSDADLRIAEAQALNIGG